MKTVEFMTAIDKELVLKQWRLFLKGEFRFENFTHQLYDHLHLHCSFIAHYDRGGFFDFYFQNSRNTTAFILQFTNGKSVEYGGDRGWLTDPDYEDLNQAMCTEMQKYTDTILKQIQADIVSHDILQAKALAGKHGYKLVKI
jgi:hypothetical protein